MAPLLIDSRDILKLGLASVLITMLVFAGGFFIGHQRAADFYQAGSEVRSLSLPERVAVGEDIADSRVPETVAAGEEIDVDHLETGLQLEVPLKTASVSAKAAVNSSKNIKTSVSQKNNTYGIAVAKQQMVHDKGGVSTKENSPVAEAFVSTVETSMATTLTLDELNKIKYSIQVGMYGRLVNAENMVKMLQAQKYDAYVTDYTNRKNEIRYNVRFGYFPDKKSAIARLSDYKSNQQGDGYLVKFSAENIVKVAGAAGTEQAADNPVQNDKTDEDRTQEKAPSAVMPDNISQADAFNNMLAAKN